MQNTRANNLARILFITDVEEIIGRDRLTLRRWWVKGFFPKPVKLNGTTLAWSAKVIDAWINENLSDTKEPANSEF
jgi:prophage regulatory protein